MNTYEIPAIGFSGAATENLGKYGRIEKAARTIPGKAYIYRAMNKPMILGDTPANHELFSADQNTIFVPAGDARFLTNAILHFFGDSSA